MPIVVASGTGRRAFGREVFARGITVAIVGTASGAGCGVRTRPASILNRKVGSGRADWRFFGTRQRRSIVAVGVNARTGEPQKASVAVKYGKSDHFITFEAQTIGNEDSERATGVEVGVVIAVVTAHRLTSVGVHALKTMVLYRQQGSGRAFRG